MPIDMSPEKWKVAMEFAKKCPNLFPEGTAGIIARKNGFIKVEPPLDISKMDKPAREKYLLENFSMF